ncbi:PREDICTED: uncharacterized protein LOC105562205 [Vollenhovia emeryi]|uniref:uncharacterized protein LOC105562205 n=1 Tax=Vollenhovia emeryi TaxID=411798 RepID=UPI0005F4167B|nr:PREDICTED: uncharacterized protein LOC105562205 [Vollenhovia emeryi]
MRVNLLLILFFASTVLALSARNRRDTNVTTVQPPTVTTTETNDGSTTTDVTTDTRDRNCKNIFLQPIKIIVKFIKPFVIIIYNASVTFLNALNSTSDFVLRSIMQPFVAVLKIIINVTKWVLQLLF